MFIAEKLAFILGRIHGERDFKGFGVAVNYCDWSKPRQLGSKDFGF
jgi:hypothetical protein